MCEWSIVRWWVKGGGFAVGIDGDKNPAQPENGRGGAMKENVMGKGMEDWCERESENKKKREKMGNWMI